MSHRSVYKKILEKKANFDDNDLNQINNGIEILESNIKGPRFENGVFINAPNPSIFSVKDMKDLLIDLKKKRRQIKKALNLPLDNNLSPGNSSQGSNGGGVTIKYGDQYYKIQIGSRGGKYILCKGKKIYV